MVYKPKMQPQRVNSYTYYSREIPTLWSHTWYVSNVNTFPSVQWFNDFQIDRDNRHSVCLREGERLCLVFDWKRDIYILNDSVENSKWLRPYSILIFTQDKLRTGIPQIEWIAHSRRCCCRLRRHRRHYHSITYIYISTCYKLREIIFVFYNEQLIFHSCIYSQCIQMFALNWQNGAISDRFQIVEVVHICIDCTQFWYRHFWSCTHIQILYGIVRTGFFSLRTPPISNLIWSSIAM